MKKKTHRKRQRDCVSVGQLELFVLFCSKNHSTVEWISPIPSIFYVAFFDIMGSRCFLSGFFNRLIVSVFGCASYGCKFRARCFAIEKFKFAQNGWTRAPYEKIHQFDGN